MSSWAPPPLSARVAASRDLPLVGRRSELETFEAIWAEVERGRRQLVFIGGEPGAGKSRLTAEVAGALRDDGVTVLVGASNPDAGVPYQPFAEMLDHLFTGTAPGSLAALLDDGGVELRRLSAHVTRHRPEVRESLAGSGEVRRDLFDAVAGLSVGWLTTARWRWFLRISTGRSCRRSRCSSTWCTPRTARACWCW